MAEVTYVGAGLPNLVTRLRDLIPADMMADFEKLNTYVVNAGPSGMDAAQWLEAVVKDRRAGLIAHARLLQTTFTSLAAAIDDAARVMSGTDADAAAGLEAVRSWLTSSDPTSLPTVVHAYTGGRTSYDSGDRGGDPKLAYGVTASGERVTKDGGVVIDLPSKKDAPAPDVYQDIFKDLPRKNPNSTLEQPELTFLTDKYVVK